MVEEEVRPAVEPAQRHRAVLLKLEEPPLPGPAEVFERSWYVAQVASGREQLVGRLLRERDHAAVIPVVERFRLANRYSKRKEKVRFALMPRYLIVGFEKAAMQPWRDLLGLTFVQAVIRGHDGYPMPVVRPQLAKFIELLGGPTMSAPDWERHMITGQEFRPGDYVDVVQGAWRGHQVRVEDIEGEAAHIIMMLFNRELPVQLPLAALRKSA